MVRLLNESNRKYNEVKVLQGYYDLGWEDLEEVPADDRAQVSELMDDLRTYRENENTSFRVITRKVPNPDYDPSRARRSRDHGILVVTKDGEVWFSDDETLNKQFFIDNDYMYDTWFNYYNDLYRNGYEFIKNNFRLLDDSDYDYKKRYSYYTYYLADGSRPKEVIPVVINTRY